MPDGHHVGELCIHTEQFLLRPMAEPDVIHPCGRWFSDEVLHQHFAPGGAVDEASLRRWIARSEQVPGWYVLAICDGHTRAPIGLMCTRVRGGTATTSLMVGETQYWGRNVAVEAHTAWRRHLYRRGIRRFQFRVSRRNRFMIDKLSRLSGLTQGPERGSWVTFVVEGGFERPPEPQTRALRRGSKGRNGA